MPIPPLVASGQIIAASHVNGIRNFLPLMADGTAGTPGLRFEDDPDTGIHRPGSNQLAIVTGGAVRATFSSSGVDLGSLGVLAKTTQLTGQVSNSASEADAAWSFIRASSSAGATKLLAGVTSGASYIQSMAQGTDWATKPLILQANGGRVGIGVSPVAWLDVKATDNADGIILRGSAGNKYLALQAEHEADTGGILYWNGSGFTAIAIRGQLKLPELPSANPGAGTKKLWYDPADGNRVKFAA